MKHIKSMMQGTVGQIIIAVLLVLVIIFEVRYSFGLLYNREMDSVNVFNQMAANAGKAQISIDAVTTYDEVPFDYADGDVINVDNGHNENIRVKLSGALTDDSYVNYGYYYYSDPDNISATLTVINGDVTDELTQIVHDFWYGDTTNLYKAMTGGQVTANALNYFQCSYATGDAPMLYDATAKLYYMLIVQDDHYTVLQAPNPFILTDDKVTVHFGDPSIDYQTVHTYSDYETLAAENTLRQLLEKDDDTDAKDANIDNPYVTNADESEKTYTSDTDDRKRDQMIQLGEYNWDVNGHCDETTLTIDITSQDALKSQWLLTATSYTYENAGLRISALTGTRSADEFKISGNINNTLTTERPYVLVLKFIDSKGQLVGIKVLDYRTTKIAAEGVANFSAVVTASEMAIANITSVMFDIY